MIVTANDFDSIYAMNRIIAAVQAKSSNYKVRLAGCVANRSKDTDEIDRYCAKVGFNRLAHMPDIDAIRRTRLKKKTLFAMDDEQDIVMARGRIHPSGRCAVAVGQPAGDRFPNRCRTAKSLNFWGSIAWPTTPPHATGSRHYFDRTATKAWERLTSDAPVSRIRQTVREGRDRMRALMLSRLPADLRGARVLDAGCGTGHDDGGTGRARGRLWWRSTSRRKLIEIAQDRLAAGTCAPASAFMPAT